MTGRLQRKYRKNNQSLRNNKYPEMMTSFTKINIMHYLEDKKTTKIVTVKNIKLQNKLRKKCSIENIPPKLNNNNNSN
jgi:hypothetical protein